MKSSKLRTEAMSDRFEKIINECIDRINGGNTIESCIADHTEHAAELEPMLNAMFATKSAFASVPSAPARQRARQRMLAALRESEAKHSTKAGFAFPNILRSMKVLATAAAVLVIAIVSYFGVVLTSTQIVPTIASADGNFALLISDEPNDIGDFDSLTMIVDKIHLKPAGEARKWIEIDAEDTEVDLTLLQGDNAFEIWRGDVPEGDYTEALLYSNEVSGVLTTSGDTVTIKLPFSRLSLKGDFSVGSDEEVTDFVYDITVISAGQSGKYILQPNTNESGTGKQVNRVDRQGQPQNPGDGQGQGQGGEPGGGQGQGQGQGQT